MRTRSSWRHRLLSMAMACALSVGVGGAVLAVGAPASADTGTVFGDDYPTQWRNIAMDSVFDSWGEYNRECTSFVAWRLSSENGFTMPFHDNATKWIADAQARGYAVNSTPAVGAVAATSTHVAWVAKVNSDGTVTVEEYDEVDSNHDGVYGDDGTYSSRTVAASSFSYIHFKDIVSSPPPPPNDADNDGVPDSSDLCPSVPGRGFPDGCPRLLGKLTGDFNGDGKADAAAIYRYDGNQIAIFTFAGNGNGTFANPVWGTTQSGWDGSRTTTAGVGDFNGDGKQDIAVFYRYPNNQIELFVFPGNGNGTFGNPIWANNQPSGWDGTRLLTAGVGDFNGDGKPDVAAYYRFDGNQIALFVFKGNGDGTFANPVGSYQSGWDGLRMTPAGIGDFNGDGKLDVATFYHYPGNQTELFVFLGNGDGTFASSLIWGNYQTGWDGNSVIPAGVGDFNGDGKADVATFYRESSNVIAAFVFDGNGDGTFANPVAGYYDSGWDGTRSAPDGVADLNGDGKPDLLSFYRFDGNQEELFSFLNQGGNTFADPPTWGNTQSGWDGLRVIT